MLVLNLHAGLKVAKKPVQSLKKLLRPQVEKPGAKAVLVVELFNNLPQNIETRKQFEELGLNYDKWSGSEPISFTTDKGYTFRKVDMNNIPYALFLGNHSDCCTRTNGLYSYSAVSYIRNKMFQAIEVLDKNNKPIGNTMCYIAKLNDIPCLVLDNIEMNKYLIENRIPEISASIR